VHTRSRPPRPRTAPVRTPPDPDNPSHSTALRLHFAIKAPASMGAARLPTILPIPISLIDGNPERAHCKRPDPPLEDDGPGLVTSTVATGANDHEHPTPKIRPSFARCFNNGAPHYARLHCPGRVRGRHGRTHVCHAGGVPRPYVLGVPMSATSKKSVALLETAERVNCAPSPCASRNLAFVPRR
jgi:hypothetical protein